MRVVRFAVFIGILLGIAAVPLAGATAVAQSMPPTLARPATTWVPPNPTNAAKVFRWGNKQWGDEFRTALLRMWQVNHPALVRDQHGMLTLNAPAASTTVTATLSGHDRTYGRWEARVRGRNYPAGGQPYTLYWELVPSSQSYHCGAGNLELGQYTLGTNTLQVHLRTLPDNDFTLTKTLQLSHQEFHTYAVEITPDHISWFVDTQVVATERLPAALAGVPYEVRFRVQGVPGARMNKGRMQMDWVRYYTLARPDTHSIAAPALTQTTYAGAC